jgi:phosphohistidine swiveling domain-containing protein
MKERPRFVTDLAELVAADLPRAGGKAVALGRLARSGAHVPPGLCVTTTAYDHYLDHTGLRQRLPLLLERKAFAEMRWEELWDLGLRVRHLFLSTPLPAPLVATLTGLLAPRFADRPVAVRSTAPAEDSATASFAGLHDSFVNVRGLVAILDHLRLVWASLWSDRALLYRQELGLDPAASAMAVIVQELVVGDCSGVAFSRCPGRPELAAIEAVWGLNQGLVDGDVEPDRLLLDAAGRIVERHAPQRQHACRAVSGGVELRPLSATERQTAPLSDTEAGRVLSLLRQAENHFGLPQDMEWTLRGSELFALQSRPITTAGTAEGGGDRAWYLSLHKSLAALRTLRRVIEDELLPAMERDAKRLAAVELAGLDDKGLAAAIRERQEILDGWEERYRETCIPMAHGIRLFGQLYNDRLRPDDPFAFLELLSGHGNLLAVQRNRALLELADQLRDDPLLVAGLRAGEPPPSGGAFAVALARFTASYGDLSWVMGTAAEGPGALTDLLLELVRSTPSPQEARRAADEADYLAEFAADEQAFAREVLEIGRASYRLRDNDNLFIGNLTARLREAQTEARRRLAKNEITELANLLEGRRERVAGRLTPTGSATERHGIGPGAHRQARQIVGQPAGPGLAQGRARVIRQPGDLRTFRSGEVLVCDAVDPNMTFVAPLASGIVERRGGMLIHGAIIAREYGLPCVTGVPDATELIRTGDQVTVDGYLGLVTIETEGGRGGSMA